MSPSAKFSRSVQELALKRQRNLCACCGTEIVALGEKGRALHKFGEAAHALHMKHQKFGGTADVSNCVIICEACHYSAHEGGSYRFGEVEGEPADFEFYNGPAPSE